VLEVPPLSFFLADTRSKRDFNRAFLLTEEAHVKLNEWVDDVVAGRKFGVFVSGQSLFAEPVSEFAGMTKDFEFPNYGDYRRIMLQLQRVIDEAHRPVLCLTGDVHWGRIAAAQDTTTGRNAITEMISSPSSLLTTVGQDTVRRLRGAFGGLFGRSDPWPRHDDPPLPPAFLASDFMAGRFPCSALFRQKGNHVALLSFRQIGGGLECGITYWPIRADNGVARPIDVGVLEFTTA
jgi:hypothetical protein